MERSQKRRRPSDTPAPTEPSEDDVSFVGQVSWEERDSRLRAAAVCIEDITDVSNDEEDEQVACVGEVTWAERDARLVGANTLREARFKGEIHGRYEGRREIVLVARHKATRRPRTPCTPVFSGIRDRKADSFSICS